MPSPYDVEAFETRVSYAAACIVKGCTNGRTFDTCFEMYDGDYVAEALMRRATKNPRLAEALERQHRGWGPDWAKYHRPFPVGLAAKLMVVHKIGQGAGLKTMPPATDFLIYRPSAVEAEVVGYLLRDVLTPEWITEAQALDYSQAVKP